MDRSSGEFLGSHPRSGPATDLSDLLAPGMVAREVLVSGGAGTPRQREFVAGRACAMDALAAAGCEASDIPRGPAGEPLWPTGFAGSISHEGDRALAVVVAQDACPHLGVDILALSRLPLEALEVALLAAELGIVNELNPDVRIPRFALLISAKESIFKAQFSATGAWPDFLDLSLEVEETDGIYRLHPTWVPNAPMACHALSIDQWKIQGKFSSGHALTLAELRPSSAG